MAKRRSNNPSLKRIQRIPRLPARKADAHKGDFGRVLVIGGSVGMAGAPALVGLAALRSGAGLVTITTPEPVQPTVAALCPCATSIPLPAVRNGQIDPAKSLVLLKKLHLTDRKSVNPIPDALVVGPGVGGGSLAYGRQFWQLINALRNAGVPAVIDADALNLTKQSNRIAANVWNRQRHPKTIITPHPGELARMHGVTTGKIQADREGFAVRTASMMASNDRDPNHAPVVVLKGARTVVTDGMQVYVNRTGNPGMATGGSGDVLGGVMGALLGQGLSCFDAAVQAVYIHGLAGDLAAKRVGRVSLIATDIIAALPLAFRGKKDRK